MKSGFLLAGALVSALLLGSAVFSAQVVRGTVVSAPGDSGELHIDVEGRTLNLKSADKSKLLRGQLGKELRNAALREFAPGDWVVVTVSDKREVISAKAFFGHAKGAFKRIENGRIVLVDGRRVPVNRQAQVVTVDGTRTDLASIPKGSQLRCRLNPVTGEAWMVLVVSSPNGVPAKPEKPTVVAQVKPATAVVGKSLVSNVEPKIESITFSAPSVLRAGSLLTVDIAGTPGCKASFEIRELIPPTPMKEVSPGCYRAVVEVPAGKFVRNAPVVGCLELGGTKSAAMQASRLVNVDPNQRENPFAGKESPVAVAPITVGVTEQPGPIVKVEPAVLKPDVSPARSSEPRTEGIADQAHSRRPSKITVTLPHDGARIARSIVVKGIAEPGSRVMIDITYNNKQHGILRLAGVVTSQVVSVDSDGLFRLGPIPLEGPLATKGLEFTVKTYYPDYDDHKTVILKVVGDRS